MLEDGGVRVPNFRVATTSEEAFKHAKDIGKLQITCTILQD